MRLISFAGVELPNRMVTTAVPIRRSVQRAAVAGGASYVTGIGRGELRNYSVEGMFLRGRDLSVGYAFDLERWVDRLNAASNQIGVLRGEWGKDGAIRGCNAYLVEVDPAYDIQSCAAGYQKVKLSFESSDLWYEEAPQVRVLSNTSEVHCGNAGNAATTAIEIEITSAIATSLTISNERNGYLVTYDAPKVGDTLLIKCADGLVTVGGANAYANTNRPDVQMSLMRFEAGWNRIVFDSPVSGVVRYHYAWE